jgi:uncharacterized repeat protein (TIGR01451 family)
MRLNLLAMLVILLLFLLPEEVLADGLTLTFDAHSTGGDKNSMTTYSYMKEPRIEESGHIRGLKSGSFNYFENGEEIVFAENLALDYGNATNISNSSLSHSLNLSFKGDLGISEMYGTGLFPNNRGLSAWKKIRYEKSNYLKTKDGKKIRDFRANEIWVDANVDMYTQDDGSEYSFTYGAGAKDAVIATWDSAGWSNRTGSRRLDLEHDTLMTGNFELNNVLQERMAPASDLHGDWLPCCFNSTLPTLRQPGNQWPSQVVINVLREYPFQPQMKSNCTNETSCTNLSTKDGEICKEGFTECPEGGCPGFECIKTFNEEEYESVPESEIGKRLNGIQSIYGYSSPSIAPEIVVYQVSVTNIGKNPLSNVTLKGTLPGNAISNLSYVLASDSTPSEIAPEWDSTQKSFTYKIDSLNRNSRRIIYLATSMGDGTVQDDAKFSAIGYSNDGSAIEDEASWLPADEIAIDIGYENALEKLRPRLTQGETQQDTYVPEIQDVTVEVNDTNFIYIANISNKNQQNLPIEQVTLAVILPIDADPVLSYEVDGEQVNLTNVKDLRESHETSLSFEWSKIDANETKEIHISIPLNMGLFDRDMFELIVEYTREKSKFKPRYKAGDKDQIVENEEDTKNLLHEAEMQLNSTGS